jgi:hypothetical protein
MLPLPMSIARHRRADKLRGDRSTAAVPDRRGDDDDDESSRTKRIPPI